jgi:hypothetical protein
VQNTLPVTSISINISIKIYRILTLFVAIYGCGTWSRRVREEYMLRGFEMGELREVYWSEKDEVTGE